MNYQAISYLSSCTIHRRDCLLSMAFNTKKLSIFAFLFNCRKGLVCVARADGM